MRIDLEHPPALSQSIAWTMLSRSPFHAWHQHPDLGGLRSPPTEDGDAGTLVHELVLGGSNVEVLDFKDWRTNEAKAARAAARDDGRTPVLQKKIDAVQPAVAAITAALDADGLAPANFTCEKRIRWDYGGIRCEGTPDAYRVDDSSAIIWELKTTKTLGNRIAMSRKGAGLGWPIQREAYVTALETLHPHVAGRVEWHWVLAELERPHRVVITSASPSMVELGRLRWERAVIMWRELIESGWQEPWSDTWTMGLEAPEYELAREVAALDELTGANDER